MKNKYKCTYAFLMATISGLLLAGTATASEAFRDALGATNPVLIKMVSEYERLKGKTLSDEEIKQFAETEHYALRMGLHTACPSCYDVLVRYETEIGRYLPNDELIRFTKSDKYIEYLTIYLGKEAEASGEIR